MTTAKCNGNDELDFRLIFGEDGQPPSLGPAELEPDDSASFYMFNIEQPPSANQGISIPRHGLQSLSPIISPQLRLQAHKSYEGSCDVQELKYSPVGGPKTFECPSIQITSISPNCQQEIEEANEHALQANSPENDYSKSPLLRDHLYLPLDHSYRDTSLSPSPASSLSSRSWYSDASSCESFSHVYDDVESELNEAAARFNIVSPSTSPGGSPRRCPGDELWQATYGYAHSLSPRQSPCHSPRSSITDENWLSPRPPSRPSSRPTSPCGKRRHSSADICYPSSLSPHHSPTPSPGHSPRSSVIDDTWLSSTSFQSGQGIISGLTQFQCCPTEADIPTKTRKTSQDQTTTLSGKVDQCLDDTGNISPSLDSPVDDAQHALKKDATGEQFLSVPSHFTWSKPKPGHTPIFRTSSLPPLDWPLPSQFGQYDLKIEVHPKAHHRAHYETEGSRGAIKATSGGHPVVKLLGYNEKAVNLQMFIGTADDRYLRPHAFYQVHRITGKTVATASQETIITSTKVLEIPLLPENNMSASIDCAGILKLRNSDIELRKGETDIGRKNTRVRVVFRVHIPQAGGKVLSLQVASIPIECSQRSAQELPQIEKYSLSSCSVNGGEEMVITGSNFFPESKVVFLEKGPDGRPQWEVDAKIMREKFQGTNIVVEVPPYRSKTISSAVQVQFFVCNGKRKRSQSQRFTYLSVLIKQEHQEDPDLPTTQPISVPMPGIHAVRAQLASSDPSHLHESLLSVSPRNLVSSLQHPQPAYASIVASAIQHMPNVQALSIGNASDCQMVNPSIVHQNFHNSPPPPVRPSYQTMQQSMMYNGQSGLPMNSASSQGYERVQFQSDAVVSHPLNHGCQPIVYHSSSPGSTSTPPPPLLQMAASSHSGQSTPNLPPLGYHCPNAPTASSPTAALPLAHPSQHIQSMSYHSANPGAASSPSPTAPLGMVHSPHSGPSSPQIHSMPYQSPTSGPASSPSPTSATSMIHLAHSGQQSPQAHSPVMTSLSGATSIIQQHVHDSTPYSTEKGSLDIKQEPEEGELTFQSIGLQDITLDDVNEIIGRDMSQSPEAHGAATHMAAVSRST
ncbi:nuclear factor of activated T-cells, cytoplasmic 3 isoform X1 [Erpetoichthys calabaricus]|uniref:Nuclear factor of activated T cells 3 n=1 Tax=Erpetoichthys calabaricus TaxID=27687 RepID=A0A8C4SWM6_ERPCA|nr:nuclear factor of activated T-cells, cytoplasmic 3 isoform X1 [Erpetoichthys calabaricus]